MMKHPGRLIFVAFTALSVLGYMKARQLPAYENFDSATRLDPLQQPTARPPFHVEVGGYQYTVTPLRYYRITGMVVSCGFSKALSEYYKDSLNIKDAGLIWGDNLKPEIYRKFKFWTNGVRLFFETRDRAAFDQMNPDKVSNNHLLCADPDLAKRIKALKRGDVVSIKGLLVSYNGDGRGARVSSLTRTDSGDGACEVVWVDELEVLQDGTRRWHVLFKGSLYGVGACVAVQVACFLFLPIKPYS